MRVLIVSNMYPTRERPEFGVFVRDQLEALGRIDGVEPELYVFEGGGARAYRRAVKPLKQHLRQNHYDVVHAHYGLTGWVARKAGAKPLVVTMHGTDLRDRRAGRFSRSTAKKADQVIAVSDDLAAELDRVRTRREPAVLPTGVDLDRFKQSSRSDARRALGLDPEGSYALLPADPARPVKRHDLAQAVVEQVEDLELLTLGGIAPEEVPTWINAADVTLVPSDHEGFGLAVLESLACNTPVVATPVGAAPQLLAGVEGCHCLEWDLTAWTRAVDAVLEDPDPRVAGRRVAQQWSSDAMAARLVALYEQVAGDES